MILFINVLFVLYLFMILFFLIGWFSNNYKKSKKKNRLSIVIAVRNEQDNIVHLIEDLKLQDYDKKLFDVIIVDDHSNDKTLEILNKKSKAWSNLKVFTQDKELSGKKHAILKGVNQSNSEIIVTTDADCRLSNSWLTIMNSYFEDDKIKLISGPVSFNLSSKFFSKIQTLEFLSLIGSAAGAIGIGKPILCNGANLAYRRNVFLEFNDYASNDIVSGDDVFLLHAIKNKFPNSIKFVKNYNATVLTNAVSGLYGFINQRKRWSAKSKYYKDIDTIFVAVIVFLTNLSIVFLSVGSFFDHSLIEVFFIFFLVKLIIDLIFLLPVLFFFKRMELIKWIFPLQFIYPFYITLASIFSNIYSFKWKGRVKKS